MNPPAPALLAPLHRAARRPRRGFALIVTISLMTLLLLLALALTTLVQLNLDAANTTLYNTEAKQNALLAAYIGLGQLQKFAGPDQRVTTTADLGRFASGANQEPSADIAFAAGSFFNSPINSNGSTPAPVSPTPAPFGSQVGYLQAGTRFWTAVWGQGTNPLGLYTGQAYDYTNGGALKVSPEPILMNWLVSGDESTPLLANTYVGGKAGNGVVQSPQSQGNTFPSFGANTTEIRSEGSPDFGTWSALTSDITMKNSTQSRLPAVVLVGPNTAGTNNEQKITINTGPGGPSTVFNKIIPDNNMIVAPVVNIMEPAESSAGTVASGRYAWFVQDEGVKAKFNIVDPNPKQIAVNTPGLGGQLSRYRFYSPMRTGIERMGITQDVEMTSYGAVSSPLTYNSTAAAELTSIMEPAQMLLIDSNFTAVPGATNISIPEQTLQLHYHDFTPYSYGVLADSLRGGLRYDLTAAFEPGNPSTFVFQDPNNGLFGRAIIPANVTGAPTLPKNTTEPNVVGGSAGVANTPVPNGLTNVDGTPFHGPAAPDPVNPTQPGLKWNVVQSYYALAANNTGSQAGEPAVKMQSATPTQAGVSPTILEARLRFGMYVDKNFEQYIAVQPLFVLANPYNFPITDPGGGIDLGYRINTDTKWEWGFAPSARNDDRVGSHGSGVGFVIGADNTMNINNPNAGAPSLLARFGGDDFFSVSGLGADPNTVKTLGGVQYPIEGYYPFVKNPVSYSSFLFPTGNQTNQLYNSVLDQVAFHIPHPIVFQPGEAKVFVLTTQPSGPNLNNLYVVNTTFYNPAPITIVSIVGTANATVGNSPHNFAFTGNQIIPVTMQAKIPSPDAADDYYMLRDTGMNTGPTKVEILPTIAPNAAAQDFNGPSGPLPNNPSQAQVSAYAASPTGVWPDPRFGFISTMYGSVAMTLELRYDTTEPVISLANDGASTLPVTATGTNGIAAPGTNVLQAITNLDLTGDGYYTDSGNVFQPAGSINPQSPQGFRRQFIGTAAAQGDGAMPAFLADYTMAMVLPGPFDPSQNLTYNQDPNNSGNGALGLTGNFDPGKQGSYRTYHDYNLRAANMNLPPFAPLNPTMTDGGVQSPATNGTASVPTESATLPAAAAFINVPPYGRVFNQGPGNDDSVNPLDGDSSFTYALGQNGNFEKTVFPDFANTTYDTGWGYALGGNFASSETTGQQFCVLYGIPQRGQATAGGTITNSNIGSGNPGQIVPDVPILSLGQLQHADVTADDVWVSVGYQPGNAIGNSYSNLYVSRTSSVQTHKINDGRGPSNPNGWASSVLITLANTKTAAPLWNNGATTTTTTGTGTLLNPNSPANAYDISYLMNVALWDRYFFSTLSQTGVTVNPANNRLKYAAGFAPSPAALGINGTVTPTVVDPATGLTMFRAYAPARYLMIDGAFNINSTSVEAWKAILSALRNVALASGPGTDTSGNPVSYFPRNLPSADLATETAGGSPVSKAILPGNFTNGMYNVGGPVPPGPGDFAGFRQLTDFDIDSLAVKIVQQIRYRGPFLSLAQFINRRLTPTPALGNIQAVYQDPTSISGALQTAIDISSETNNFPSQNAFPAALTPASNSFSISVINSSLLPGTNTGNITKYTPDSGNGANSGQFSSSAYPAQSADPFSRLVGMPGWLTQADILEALAPILSARSDTFVIRTYGEVLSKQINQSDIPDSIAADPSVVLSRAWCEMVVQRVPDYIATDQQSLNDPSTTSGFGAPNPAALGGYNTANQALSPVNATFGRRFRIVAVRWLSPTDI